MLQKNAMASVIWVMAVIGAMPLALPAGYRLRSTLPWCALTYSVFVASGAVLVWDQVPVLLAQGVDLDTRMVATELIVHLLPLLFVPIFWWQAGNICRMTAGYCKTKRMIGRVTGSSWRRDARRRRVYAVLTVLLVVLSLVLVAAAYVLVGRLHLRPPHLPALFFSMVLQTLVGYNVVIQLLQLLVLARSIRHRFARVAHSAGAGTVRAYRELWVELRELYGYDDHACHAVYAINMLYLLAQSTMVSFEAFSFYVAGDRWASIGHGVFALVYFAEIFTMCECAHLAVGVMKEPFVAVLDRMSIGRLDHDTYHEVCFFYNTIIAQSPNYSIRGYASLDRPYLASILMAIVSYTVFLAQCRSQAGSTRALVPVGFTEDHRAM
ncbi:Gustatory receptor 10 [Frankliniella occidentalis]|nr:Gustatory receptor 10 [Frankliniella occidentalis]